jgi:hypothetical protein
MAPRVDITLGPQELDQNLAGMAPLPVVGEVGEECRRFLRPETRDYLLALHGAQSTEELYLPPDVHLGG